MTDPPTADTDNGETWLRDTIAAARHERSTEAAQRLGITRTTDTEEKTQ